MNKTDITVKNVKSMLMSDGYAFTCVVYVKGKKAFHVENDGNGGCNMYYPCVKNGSDVTGQKEGWALIEECEEFAKTLPPYKSQMRGLPELDIEYNLDMLIDDLINEQEENKKLKKLCKTKTVWSTPDMKEGEYYVTKIPYNEAVKQEILTKYPNAVIINETLGI